MARKRASVTPLRGVVGTEECSQWAGALDAVDLAILSLDADGRIGCANAAAGTLLGIDVAAESAQTLFSSLQWESDWPVFSDASAFPWRGIASDGDRTLQVDLASVEGAGGHEGVIATFFDLAEALSVRKGLEAAAARAKVESQEIDARLSGLVSIAEKAAAGDLSPVEPVPGEPPSLARLRDAVAKLIASTRATVEGLQENTAPISSASEELDAASKQLQVNSGKVSEYAGMVSSAAAEVSANVGVVSTGADEMKIAIREISSKAAEAAEVAREGVETANVTNETVGQLGVSSAEIGKVVKVITSVAQQTNLLALNATIEAARAGDAGRGFAVVANEVKELAKETAAASEDIAQKIEAIQRDTQSAVEAILKITEVIGSIDEIQASIASAVEEQSATTDEIARNVADASRGSAEISKNITSVATLAAESSELAEDTQAAASFLKDMAGEVDRLLSEGFQLED